MKHAIDPKVDCVFKALLGTPENSNLLVNFLNAMLGEHLAHPIQQVEILNPYNEREYLSDKLSIVDIKAQDSYQQTFQVEIQLSNYPGLPARILYNWADIYSQQLKSGENYGELKATYAIWLLNENLYADDDYIRHFQVCDTKGRSLIDHCHITLVELKKFHTQVIHNNQDRWLQFFNQAENFDDSVLPDWMNTQEMKQAMNTLSRFSEQDREYFAYQARQEYIRQQNTINYERERAEVAKLQAIKESKEAIKEAKEAIKEAIEKAKQEVAVAKQQTERIEQEKEDALAELAELKKLLATQKNQR